MSLRLRVMQRDGWPRTIPPRRGPWLWDCMPDTILHLSVCDNPNSNSTPSLSPPPTYTSHHRQTSQIDAAHWCAVRQIRGLSNTPPTHKEWWVRDSAWNGGKTHTHASRHTHVHTHTYVLTSSWNGSLNLAPNDEHFFCLLCHLSHWLPHPSLSLSTHILDMSWSKGCF